MSGNSVVIFFLQLGVMLAATLLMGKGLRRLGVPLLVGELFGGIVIGPTVLGALYPDLHGVLFPPDGAVVVAREGFIQFGLVLFLFVAGLEVDLRSLVERKRTVALTSILGLSVPFLAGMASVLLWPDLWQLDGSRGPWVGPLFVGTILSISAIPVIARILFDLNLMGSPFGATVLAAATLDDLIGWTLFGVILSQFDVAGRSDGSWWVNLALVALLAGVILSIGTVAGRRALKWITHRVDKSRSYVPLIVTVVLIAASCAEAIGTHAIFGAFLVGVAVARTSEPRRQAYAALRGITLEVFVPLYLVSIGLRTNFATNFDPWLVAVVLLVATVGKLVGASGGAWLGGLSLRESLAMGFALNARGAMGIVLTGVALDYSLISERVFVALVFMAVATSALGAAVIPKLIEPGPPTGTLGGNFALATTPDAEVHAGV